jgi:hypothetical protein
MMVAYFKEFYNNNRAIAKVVLFGLCLRLIFTWLIAPYYFNRANIHFDNDTSAWMEGLYNLIFTGEFTLLPNHEMAYYCRMPGYSLFMAPAFGLVSLAYYLQGIDVSNHSEMWYSVLKLTAYFQIILDTISIYLIYYITTKSLKNHALGIITAILYATYPFVIVWTPVCYSEIPSLFFALLALALSLKSEKKYVLSFAGICLGFAVLNRPQLALLAPLMIFFFYQKYTVTFKNNLSKIFLFYLFFTISYGAWPLRNYIRFNKIIVTQDLRGFDCWNDDVLSFMQYIYSVKAEWQPQFSDILHNKEVVFPKESYLNVEDSLKLERAVYLSKNCGRGFSEWAGYHKATIPIYDTANDCSAEIAKLYNELRQNQIKQHPFNFYIKVPLKNLQKAIFKSDLSDNASVARKLGAYLFYYRTTLILIGLLGLWLLFKHSESRPIGILVGAFFWMLYLYLCFGTSPQCRNIEMRYFLQADVFMLIPAAYVLIRLKFIEQFISRYFSKSKPS